MLCSNCGKDIPFTGKVCPWCKADKSSDQSMQVMGIAGSIIAGFIGWTVTSHIGYTLLWALGGCFIAMIIGKVLHKYGIR